MSFSRLLDCLVSRRRLRSTSRTFRPSFDKLEERSLMATFTVDDSFAADNAAQRKYNTIQEAVDAASSGDHIRVMPGTYTEAVNVPKRLTIQAQFDADQLFRPSNEPKTAVVEIPAGGAFGFNLAANDIVIRGFRIQDNNDDGVSPNGVVTSRATSGHQIQFNVIQSTTAGIYLNTNGAKPTVVKHNLIRNNNQPGSAAGNGIYSDQGASNVQITGNIFTGHLNASMIFVGGGTLGTPNSAQSNLKITHNVIRNDASMILANTTNSEISHNASLNSNGSGIFLAGGCSGVTIKNNALTNGAFTGINLRFLPGGNPAGAYNVDVPNSNIQIVNNVVSGFGDAGIRLREGANLITVKNNVVTNNGSVGGGLGGIILENADNNRIESNTLRNNKDFGIRVDVLSTGNTITKNTASGNSTFDYADETVPPVPPAGPPTVNSWTKNKGKTQNRTGLIS